MSHYIAITEDTYSFENAVRDVVNAFSTRKLADLTPASHLEDDLGYTSLGFAELAFALEDLFDLEPVVPEVAVQLQTVSDITELLGERIEEGDATAPTRTAVLDYIERYSAE